MTSISFRSESGEPLTFCLPRVPTAALFYPSLPPERLGERCIDDVSSAAPGLHTHFPLGLELCPAPPWEDFVPLSLAFFSLHQLLGPWHWNRLDSWRGVESKPGLSFHLSLGLDLCLSSELGRVLSPLHSELTF